MKKIISLALAVMMACLFASVSFAEEVEFAAAPNPQVARFTGLTLFSASLDSSGKNLYLSASAGVRSGYTCKITYVLQERSGSGDWVDKVTYTATGDNRTACLIGETEKASSGCDYRGSCTVQAFDASGNEVDNLHAYTTILGF